MRKVVKVTEKEDAQNSPDYDPENYRGKMCDEAVIETLKDCLRPLYGF